MKFHTLEAPSGKYPPPNTHIKVLLIALTLSLLTVIPLCLNNSPSSPLPSPESDISSLKSIEQGKNNISGLKSTLPGKNCDVFRGNWVPYPNGTYYTNTSCSMIIDQQNCLKFGRPDTEFLKWRWKPEECELPFFDAVQFLELVRGKSLAFLGDSVGRNQMQSLLCLLSSVAYPEDLSHDYSSNTDYFKRYLYTDYQFTIGTLWAPFLVKFKEADPSAYSFNSIMNLYLDEPDEAWATEVEKFDYVIVSAGQWFFRPLLLSENGQVIGCSTCQKENITDLTPYYAYRNAFRTVFRTLQGLKNYKGVTFLRTFSPAHFENGAWNEGGNCVRTKPFTKEEMKLDGYMLEMYLNQVEELKAAEKQGRKMGLQFRLLDTTEAMLLRPDGHPNYYGRSPHRNMTLADCVHWCLPGPIDTWNEFLLYMLKTEQSS
ncbi:hypothetical protein FEM48_Zijuj04G0065700 [Ziziphus jujuba var. spinosa]|uniref:Protein trichome birefringence-like 19 n=1 Tax=Ziziphus jujuba var. spinosa TaxID=714518 RepID=A0A978VIC6_ZIZJJ|nr:hypothetical protein FEM48_Zijuj04G0065700 [Ziziphus jujuba var. spinosa]